MEDLTRKRVCGNPPVPWASPSAGSVALGTRAAHAEEAAAGDGDRRRRSRQAAELTGLTGTPDAIAATGGSTMPLAELNRRRRAYVDAHSEYTCADGTVIPSPFVQMHTLIRTYGFGGFGNVEDDRSFDYLMAIFSEDDAKAYVDEIPWGVTFTAYDMYACAKGGRPLEECAELLERFSREGFLERHSNPNGANYNQIPLVVGILEFQMDKEYDDPDMNIAEMSIDKVQMVQDFHTAATPAEYTVPCHKSVVADEGILPYDDAEQIIRTKDKFAIAPCYCRYTRMIGGWREAPLVRGVRDRRARGLLLPDVRPAHGDRPWPLCATPADCATLSGAGSPAESRWKTPCATCSAPSTTGLSSRACLTPTPRTSAPATPTPASSFCSGTPSRIRPRPPRRPRSSRSATTT